MKNSKVDNSLATFTGQLTPTVLAIFLFSGCLVLLYHMRISVSGAPLVFETAVKVCGLLVVLISFVVIRKVLISVNALHAHVRSVSALSGRLSRFDGASFGPVTALADAFNTLVDSEEWQRRQLGEAREVYRTVVSFSDEAVVWFRPDGRVRYVTPSVTAVAGCTDSELLAGSDELGAHVASESLAEWTRIVVTGDDHHHAAGQVCFRLPSGLVRHLELKCDSVYGETGEFIGTRLSMKDATQLVDAREQFVAEIDELSKKVCSTVRDAEASRQKTLQRISAAMRQPLEQLSCQMREAGIAMLALETEGASLDRVERAFHLASASVRRLTDLLGAVDAMADGVKAQEGRFELGELLEDVSLINYGGRRDWYAFTPARFDAGLRGDRAQMVGAVAALLGALGSAGPVAVSQAHAGIELSCALPDGYDPDQLTLEYARQVILAQRGLFTEQRCVARVFLSF